MESSGLGPPNSPSVDVASDHVFGDELDGYQTVEYPFPELDGQVTAPASLFQSQGPIEAEHPSSAAPPALSFAQHPPLTLNLAPTQQISTITSDQKSNTVESSEVTRSDYYWRKYGQKQFKGSEHLHSYYKCSYKNCAARKKVEHSLDGQVIETIHTGEHDHQGRESTEDSTIIPPWLISEGGKGIAVSVEMSGPVSQTSASVGPDREGTGSSMIEEASSLARISELDKLKAPSVEDQSGIGEVFSMPSKMSDLYDSTGKLLPINSERQQELIPTAEENVDVRANIIFLDRDYSEEPNTHIPSRQETVLPTVPSPSSLAQRGNSQPESQSNTETVDPKKRKLYKLFRWMNKKRRSA